MFSFIKLFRKSPIQRLSGGGMIFFDDQQKYYIDSETDIDLRQKSVIIFRQEIRKVINNDYTDASEKSRLTDLEKNQIALNAKKVLQSEGFKVSISPELPLGFSIKNE